jgi:hypothetical protein
MGGGGPEIVSREAFAERLVALCRSGVGPGLPRKRRDAHVFLRGAAAAVPPDVDCSEAQVNAALDGWLAAVGDRVETDRVSLRRALVDWGYLERDTDGARYRRGPGMPGEIRFAPAVDAVDAGAAVREANERNDRRRRERGGG